MFVNQLSAFIVSANTTAATSAACRNGLPGDGQTGPKHVAGDEYMVV